MPNGFDVIKKRGLVKFYINCNDTANRNNYDVSRPRCHSLSWCEFKALYDRDNAVKDLFSNGIMEIECDIINLSCQEDWKCLEERSGIRVLLAQCEATDETSQVMISFLKLEKAFTNDGVPVLAMNVYGANNNLVAFCHFYLGNPPNPER